MREDLVPIDLKPGYVNNGTTYQSKNRWFTGDLVRFFQGTIQPIGGWTKRTTTGATITGQPNAALAWQDNANESWLAIGTASHLYVLKNSTNVVYDITPGIFNNGGQSASWQLDTFGAYLVAVYNGTGTNPSGNINMFYWAGDPATAAQPIASDVLSAPFLNYGVVTTPERFVFMLRGSDPLTLGGNPMKQFRATRSGATSGDMVD